MARVSHSLDRRRHHGPMRILHMPLRLFIRRYLSWL